MEKSIKSFRDLEIWQLSHKAALSIYSMISNLPRHEEYNLKSQIIRAAVSIPTNIAEGMGRYSRKEFIQYLNIARGSIEECKYLLILSRDLKYINDEYYNNLLSDYDLIGKKTNALINSLRTKEK